MIQVVMCCYQENMELEYFFRVMIRSAKNLTLHRVHELDCTYMLLGQKLSFGSEQ